MTTYTAYLTGPDQVPRRMALLAFHMADAHREARLLGLSMFHGSAFTFSVREAA